MSNNKTITTETQLREAAKEALEQDGVLRWRWKAFEPRPQREIDALLELVLDRRRLVFEVDFKLTPSSRTIERLSNRGGQRPKLLVAPSLSEVLVQHCRTHGVSCLDLNGQQWIRAEGLVVDRRTSERRRFRPAQLPPDPFQPKSSRLLRALIAHPERRWSQKELRERTGLSPGLVSRLVRHLDNEGLLGKAERTLWLKQPDALLDQWAREDDWGKRTTLRQYSLLVTDLEEIARWILKTYPQSDRLVFTQWFAANLRHPYTTPPLVSAYVPTFPGEIIERKLVARQVTDGGTLWLVVPSDEGVFRETQKVGEFTLACDTQIYLDLLHVGLRGPEQAKALREWKGFRRSAA
ncbi:MAG: MarR family transcriptional regulator [Verrucomicrobia bacterium]|nr:MarR family transcriptional regulator [Verrucomicrobiota bacterium]